eukprot:m.35355 g.35355  ORF g.35355 m.35355 type:complete len:429 (+) comp5314_c0_seq1:37-1323(+)
MPPQRHELHVVHANIVLYSMAHWMCVPIIPFLSKRLGADPVMFGYLQTAAGLAQLIGGPLLGWLVDVRGARSALIVSQLAGALSYLCLALAWTVPMLFLSKIPTIFQHALQAAQMCVTLMSDVDNRPKMIAHLSLYYGVGFVVGPAVGGGLANLLGESGQQTVALIAAAISFVCVWVNLTYLPPLYAHEFSAKSEAGKGSPDEGQVDSAGEGDHKAAAGPASGAVKERAFADMFTMILRPGLRNLLLFSLMVGLALSSYYTGIALAAEPQFGMSEKGLGTLMSFVGGLSMIVNAVGIPFLSTYFPRQTIVYFSMALMAVSLSSLSLATDTVRLYLLLIPLVVSMAIFRAYSVSLISAAVPTEEAGSAISLAHAAQSLSGVVAPAVSGHVFRNLGFSVLCLGQGAAVLVAWLVLHLNASGVLSGAKKSQ